MNNPTTIPTRRNTTTRDRHRQTIARARPDCALCGEPIDYTITDRLHPRAFVVDHIIPLARGGTDTLDNKQAAHRECNAKKAARLIAPIVRRSRTLR